MKKAIGIVAVLCMSLLMSSNLTNEQVPQEKQSVKAKLDAKIYHYQNNQSRDNNLFFSEYAEGSSNNKYLEIYNPTGADVDLSGYALANVSNAPSEVGVHEYWLSFAEGAVIAAGDVYVVCHPSSDDYILNECDQTHSYMSNGDDGYALAAGSEDSYVYIDWVGDFNGDPGSAWDVCGAGDTKDNTLVRSTDVCSGSEWSVSSNADSCEWTVLDNNTWDYLGSHDGTACEAAACPDGTVDDCSGDGDCAPSSWIGDGWCDGEDQPFGYDLSCYDNDGSDCGQTCADQGLVDDCDGSGECAPGSWIGDGWCDGADQPFGYDLSCYDCDGGDCADDCGECGGDNSTCTDDCGVVNGDNSTCSSAVTFSVDMNLEGVTGDVKVRTSTVNGDYNPSDWFVMDDSDGDMVYTYTMSLVDGVTYGYNFNDGSYESGDGLGDCAGGNYGNDRYVTPAGDMVLDTVCWESCEACATVIPGCTDDEALNFDENATEDDGSCYYEYADTANLFFSECAEGSSNNKYLEIYNASGAEVDMSGYSLSSCSNGCNETDVWDYADNVTFDAGTMVAAGDVFVVCHGSADDYIQAECDATFTYLSNGDDVFALTQIGSGVVLDVIGTTGDDPGSGWEVAGVGNATKDHTIVRKSSVTSGTTDWAMSAGTNADDSEWVVFDQNTWDYLGSHPHEFVMDVEGCMDANATNYDPEATVQSYNEFDTSTCTYASCADIPTEMGCLWEDGTSSEWWDGWWNCEGGQVCGLAEVVFELNLPEDIAGTPHVNGSYNGWCGSCYNAMSDDDGDGTWSHVQYFGAGEVHDYKFTIDGWSNQEDLYGLPCAVETDGYWNRQFTAGDANTSQTQTFCWGTCEAECATGCPDGTVADCAGDGDCAPASWVGDGWCDGTDQPFGADLTCYDNDGGDCLVTSMVTFDIDGVDDCGFVSVTGTFDDWSGWGANTDTGMMAEIANGDHEYVILCVNTVDGWWYDIWANSTIFNAPIDGSCWNGNYDYPNYTLSVDGDMTVSVCAGSCEETCAPAYAASDVNADGATNVQDVVSIVGCILDTAGVCEFDGGNGDVNGDGLVNVQDVVAIVGTILGGRTTSDATDATLNINDGSVSLKADGFIGAVQMTLSHDAGFAINLTDKAMVADYRTNGNSTTLIVIAPEGDYLFDATGEFTFEEVMVYNSEDEVSTSIVPTELALGKAYPNPFNPSTSLSIALPADGFVSISVYNVMGQQVDVLHSGNMTAGTHDLRWNASNMTSGMYFVRAESADGVSTQKVMLMK